MPLLILLIAMVGGICFTELLMLPWNFLIGLKLLTWLGLLGGVLLISWLFGE